MEDPLNKSLSEILKVKRQKQQGHKKICGQDEATEGWFFPYDCVRDPMTENADGLQTLVSIKMNCPDSTKREK